jgi:predicted permease
MDFQTMLGLQGMLFALTLMGIYARKRNIITPEARGHLSDLLIEVILPMNIISSFEIQLDTALLNGALLAFLISFGVEALSLLIGRILFARSSALRRAAMQYGAIVSNAAFMGLPIIKSFLGAQAGLYAAIALVPLRIFMWSAGLSLFTKTDARSAFKKLIIHPCNIAVVIGFVVLFLPGGLPDFLSKAVSSVGNCATAVCMLIVGAFLADTDLKTVFCWETLYFSAVRLLLLPFVIWGLMTLLHADRLLTGVLVLLAAMPAGSTTAILAAKYGGDADFASKIIFVSTALSLFTIPLFSLLIA